MIQTLREFITYIDARCVLIFNATGVIYPMWHAVMTTGEHRIIPQPDCDKDTAALLMRAYFDLHDVNRCVFVDEAWTLFMRDPGREDLLREITKRGLKDHPDRVEVVLYQGEDATGISIGAHRVIERPAHGKATLGPLEFAEWTQSMGRFVGMLPQRGTVQ